ncbi:sensor histidine kinase [Paenibacillus eucommiae]|uniref:histidine kinase n=1 Tax=Paenibacillus eucommiae TaxID=1355755 RepID=A0ABS4J5E0_9BACL|nr:HAMP domain-containing sensor histidine kinase [Paenibacillus eucommiae]MBP1995048.1 two-component system sensor histidine kinase CssS [Paenibacillus eucommiae]
MRKLPLGIKIWLVFASLLLALSIFLVLILPSTLRSFFANQIYLTIEDSQNSILNGGLEGPFQKPNERDKEQQDSRTVRHIILDHKGKPTGPRNSFSQQFWERVQEQALSQKSETERYGMSIDDSSIQYVISKADAGPKSSYLFSYVWETFQQELVTELYRKLLYLILVVLLFSWLPSLWMVRYVSRPLGQMARQVKRIAERDWHDPVATSSRGDEIGQLADSIESMRQKLVLQDQAQQSFLQHISHELKTPIMVIRSYTNAIQEGIFPKGDVNGSILVIDQEAERLEHRVQNLLYLTKLDYLRAYAGPEQVTFDLADVIEETVERLRWKRPELSWHRELPSFVIEGYEEQWMIAMENLIDNQIRYAQSEVRVVLHEDEQGTMLRISNDGPSISEDMSAQLFQPFQKGKDGKFGLGLMIVKRTADLHRVVIGVENGPSGEGIAFTFRFN